uniref:Ribonuclease H-like domain-containing protein n=1 Tax=Tanacetum cinerariifolium TaxID=118510 RepID=A0A6L2NV56_TANCI|nr:ribonuclease H-like domain-containing protein [Tanacetum cinerariifolium]
MTKASAHTMRSINQEKVIFEVTTQRGKNVQVVNLEKQTCTYEYSVTWACEFFPLPHEAYWPYSSITLLPNSDLKQKGRGHPRSTRLRNEMDIKEEEELVSVYNRFAQLMNDLERNDMHFPIVTINTKFLNSLQPEWLKYQFEKLVNTSRAKKLEKSHDPLALVAHTSSSSRNTSSYYVTHPTSVVDYDDEYQQDDIQTNYKDPLTYAMLLLARSITQNFSNPTNNRLLTSSNTRNQAVIQGDRVNIQSRNSGNAGRNNRLAYVQEEVVEGSNETGNVQRTLRNSSSGNTSTVQCYNFSGKGHYASNCPKPRVWDSKYFMEQILLAKKDEAEHLKHGLGYSNPYTLKQAIAQCPKLYLASSFDFVPQKELFAEQKYFLSSFIPSAKNSKEIASIPASMPRMNVAPSVRRSMNRDSHDKNNVVANSKNSTKKVAVYVKKNKQIDNTFANVISNKENVIDVDVTNASKVKNILYVSCMQNVLIPCHDKCLAHHRLNASRTSTTKSRTPKSSDTTYKVLKSRFSKKLTQSKTLDTTFVVSQSNIDVGSASKAKNKVSSTPKTNKRDLRNKSLSTYIKNKIRTSQIWQKWFESRPNVVWLPVNTNSNVYNSGSSEKPSASVKKWVVKSPICTNVVSSCVAGGRESNLYTISISDMASSSPVCLMSKVTSTKSWLWHRKLSHLNFDTINDLTRLDLVDGLPKFKYEKDHLCSTCQRDKNKKASYPPKLVSSDNSKLKLLLLDLCGPMRVASINEKKYILVIVDDYSRYTWVYFLHSKDETPEIIKKHHATIFNCSYVSAMLIFSRLPKFIWAEAVATACFTQNRSIIHTRYNKTPYELSRGRKPNVEYFYVFDSLCYPTNNRDDLGKIKPKDIGVFIGYSKTSRGFRFYNQQTKKIMETIHVKYDELTTMASEHDCLEPELQRFNNINSSAETMNTPSKEDLDNLFGPMFEEYFRKKSSDTPINSAAQPTQLHEDLPSTSSINIKEHETPPIETTSDKQTSLISLPEADELHQEDSADFDGNS